jgi:hypothetical protein
MFEHIKNRFQKLPADMADRNIEMLSIGTFLCQIILKGLVPHRKSGSAGWRLRDIERDKNKYNNKKSHDYS